MNKVLLIICDGLSDRPISELGNKTPLEEANKPNLDKLVKRGMTGLMHTVDIGIRPGSDVAHLSLFGYDTGQYYTGRGPFEAAGYGIDLKPGDVALRGNFATVDDNLIIIDRRAGRINDTQELVNLFSYVNIDGVKIIIKKGTGHRVAVVLRGEDLDGKVSDTDPHVENMKVLESESLLNSKSGAKTASIINKFVRLSYKTLKDHAINIKRAENKLPPANIILLRGAGKLPSMPTFAQKYRLKAACIAGAGLYRGIAQILGMEVINVPGATGQLDTDLEAKIKTALAWLNKYDFMFVHIKGADILAEDGNYVGKKQFIEKIDKSFAPLVDKEDILIVITADHSTSSQLRMHTADPVPLLIAGKNLHTDSVESFGEREAAGGKLGHIKGKHLMPMILDFIGKAPLYGA